MPANSSDGVYLYGSGSELQAPWRFIERRVTNAALSRTQKRRRLVILTGLIVALATISVTHSATPSGLDFHRYVEPVAIAMIVICILGRTWTSLYIAGSKRVTLVDIGPFSVVRNPLYVFTIIGAFGIGGSTGSVVVGLTVATLTFLIFHLVVRSEELFLRDRFGQAFVEYEKKVPRWLPRPAAWRDEEWIRTRPSIILRTFLETSLFLVAVPVCEAIEFMQDTGVLPVLLKLP